MPTGTSPLAAWTRLFAVRPSFTFIGLRLVWFGVLIWIALRIVWYAGGVLATETVGGRITAFVIAAGLVQPFVSIVLWRLFLEVAAFVLVPAVAAGTGPGWPEKRGVLRALVDFLLFRPAFTAIGLRVVWIGYLGVTVAGAAIWLSALVRNPEDWAALTTAPLSLATGLLSSFVWLAGVRVLVEVASRILPAAAAAEPKRKPRRINVLLIGSGGREHALAWKIAQSPNLAKLYAAPGNPGIAECAELAPLDVADPLAVSEFCRAHAIELVVIGPEVPLVAGLVDDLAAAGVAAFGPGREAARLEGSKGYAKDLAAEAGIPTAAYRRFADRNAAIDHVRQHGAPIVVKANGLAAGKGVTVATTLADALAAIDACFAGSLGSAGSEVVIEECLVGEEASFFVLADGKAVLPLATAQDHKRVGEGDTGPNTGGMGAYSPAPVMTAAMVERTLAEIVHPTLAAMQARGDPFRGVLYVGLMITADGPKLIEYNVRFGDPETQVLMLRLDSDLLELLYATARGRLAETNPRWSDDAALTVVMAAEGYPGTYATGSPIHGIERADALAGVKVFQAGTAKRDGELVANGGRVLNITARGATIAEAKARAYAAVDAIDWPDGFCRRDIGWRAVQLNDGSATDATPSPLVGEGFAS